MFPTPDIPEPPPPTPAPDTSVADAAADRERKKAKGRKGQEANVLTSPLGATDYSQVGGAAPRPSETLGR